VTAQCKYRQQGKKLQENEKIKKGIAIEVLKRIQEAFHL